MIEQRVAVARVGAVIALILLAPVAAAPQAQKTSTDRAKWTAPKTPWGHPDLQGIYTNSTIVPLERPANQTKAELTDAEVEGRLKQYRETLWGKREGDTGFYNDFWWEWGKDVRRTSLIIDPPDGKLPMTEKERERSKVVNKLADSPSTYTDMNIFDRCITRSMPGAMMPGFYNHFYQILQTPDYVVLFIELVHDVRIIPLGNRPHLGQNIRQWLGDSRGRWEGDTLVVETTNLNDKVTASGATFFGVGQELHMVERFRRASPDMIDYQFTVTAPSSYTRPWTAAIPLWKSGERTFEYACHEGNYAMPNSLSGARAGEANEAARKR
jgi:hypothetical protein